MNPLKKDLIRKIINAFENGVAESDYSTIYIYRDGPNQVRQITLGFGITEYGNLKSLIEKYVKAGGLYSTHFQPYLSKIGKSALVDDAQFKTLLVSAATQDPIMRQCEDEIYDEKYWNLAYRFFESNGFTTNLSMAVIMDSFIHSGSILPFLRKRFPATVPSNGGSENEWIRQYLNTRRAWLAGHSNRILRNTLYRVDFLKTQLDKSNLDLEGPLSPNGVKVS